MLTAFQLLLALQAHQASVAGTVRSAETGEPVANAVVAMPDLARSAFSDAAGRYALRQVPAGPQHVSVRALGYASRTLHALVPRSGVLEITVSLAPFPRRLPVVAVRPPVDVRGTADVDTIPFPDRETSAAAAFAHPLLTEPDLFQALGGGEIVLQPEAPGGVHIRGGPADQTAFRLDGVPVISPYHAAGMFSAWNPDAIAAIGVSTVAGTGVSHALSGMVAAATRKPGQTSRLRGGASSTQTRLTLDGPMGPLGFLVSARLGSPFVRRKSEGSYLGSETHDWIGKIEAPAFGGELRLLGYGNDNEIISHATVSLDDAPGGALRNSFEWSGRSLGASWRGSARRTAVHVAAWSATGLAGASWAGATDSRYRAAASRRRDAGFEISAARPARGGTMRGGVGLDRIRTTYVAGADTQALPARALSSDALVATAYVRHSSHVFRRLEVDIGIVASGPAGGVHPGPHAGARWHAGNVAVSATYARLHQYAQSLRNTESVTASIFPADLFLGAGTSGVPVARSDSRIAAVEYRPLPGARFGLQIYDRAARGVVLVAVRESGPFATGAIAAGTGTARGVSAEAALSSARAGLLLSYGAQRVRHHYGDSSYAPEHGTAHVLEGGATVFPTRTSSVRLGVASGWGRRATPIAGAFEWEACNLRDRGCEFAGSPQARPDALGQSRLPPYARVDVGVRRHWHFDIGVHDVELAVFGVMTNVLNRRNVMAYTTNPVTGLRQEVEMRPQAPLVVGFDWRF